MFAFIVHQVRRLFRNQAKDTLLRESILQLEFTIVQIHKWIASLKLPPFPNRCPVQIDFMKIEKWMNKSESNHAMNSISAIDSMR